MNESTEETQARQAAALSGEIDQEVGENGKHPRHQNGGKTQKL